MEVHYYTVRWAKGKTFFELAETYHKYYIKKNYDADNLVVIFDGYNDESIKSHEHMRINLIPQSCNVQVLAENKVPFTQDRFLSNIENKSSFVKFLPRKLQEWNVDVINCHGDADATIVKSAMHYAQQSSETIVIVADDTDIAVMLVHHWNESYADIYFPQQRWS